MINNYYQNENEIVKKDLEKEKKNNRIMERINNGRKAGLEKLKEEENERNKGKLKIKEKAKKLEEGLNLQENH